MSLRKRIKRTFDSIVYQSAFLNKIVRNVNKQLSAVTSFRVRPYGVLTVKLGSGVTFKMATNETSSVTKLLFWNGADQYEYTRIFEQMIPRCQCFIDVGSNTGYYALLACSKNPGTKAYAFEPASAPFHYLETNIRINKLGNMAAFPVALSDKPGTLEFFELSNPDHYHSVHNLAGTGTLKGEDVLKQKHESRLVQVDTLDHFIETRKLQVVDLVKLDTEGTEHLVLKGAHHMLSHHKPVIICETLFNVIEAELENVLRPYGYLFFNYRNGKLSQTERLVRKEDNGVRDCFFVHADKVHLIDKFLA
jgi:FkbM family methyltransferase